FGDDWNLGSYALSLLRGGKIEDYHQFCHTLLDRVSPQSKLGYAQIVKWVLLLAPQTGDDEQRAREFASKVRYPANWGCFGEFGDGLRSFRNGDYQSTISCTHRAMAGTDKFCKIESNYLQSAAFASLKQPDNAKEAFQRAEELASQLTPGPPTGWEWRNIMW